ncbi:hypothetical protein QQ045_026686 [Rhodiola kirilowii]
MVTKHQDHHHHHMVNFFHMPHFHLHHLHHHHHHDVPKGYVAVMVGTGEEEQQRFVISIMCLNHPLFREMLKEAAEEYGFRQKGPIVIPRPVEEFRNIHGMIDQDKQSSHHHHGWCFRV